MKDFDYIKDKFDESGVNAPDEINEELIMSKLESAQPVRALPPKKSKKKILIPVSAAAAVAVVTAGAIAISSVFTNKPFEKVAEIDGKQGKVLFEETAGLRGFSDRGEIKETLGKVLKLRDSITGLNKRGAIYDYSDQEAMAGASAGSSDGGTSSGSAGSSSGANGFNSSDMSSADMAHNDTYVQTVGVDEADTVKTDGKYIYCITAGGKGSHIEIYAADGKTAPKVGDIYTPEYGDDYGAFAEFYLCGDRLVAIEEDWNRTEYYTTAYVYDISDVKKTNLVDSLTQSGNYVSSRMIDSKLYLVTNDSFFTEEELPEVRRGKSATNDSAGSDVVPVDSIFSVETPFDNSFLVISAYDTSASSKEAKTKAIIGSGDTVYCNLEYLYVAAYEYTPEVYQNMIDYNYAVDDAEGGLSQNSGEDDSDDSVERKYSDYIPYLDDPKYTQIIKISLANDIEFVASNKVEGTINNQYSLDEFKGNLRVATTIYNDDFTEINKFYVLDDKLNRLGSLEGFAQNETIQAVRYINETAYVITYEQTDPLFVINASNPSDPKILGTAEISGFSTMLVPVDENTLLGVGYETWDGEYPHDTETDGALKIVTFDVTDKGDPKVLDTKVFPHYSSEAQTNPKALLVNNERGDYTIPANYFKCYELNNGVYKDYEVPETKSGFINFRIEHGMINIIDNYVSDKFDGDDYAERCVYVGSDVYLIGCDYSYTYDKGTESDYMECRTIVECVPYK